MSNPLFNFAKKIRKLEDSNDPYNINFIEFINELEKLNYKENIHQHNDRILYECIKHKKVKFAKYIYSFYDSNYKFNLNLERLITYIKYNNEFFIEFHKATHFKDIIFSDDNLFNIIFNSTNESFEELINKIDIPENINDKIYNYLLINSDYIKISILNKKYPTSEKISNLYSLNSNFNSISELFDKLSEKEKIEFIIKKLRITPKLTFLSKNFDNYHYNVPEFSELKCVDYSFNNNIDNLVKSIITSIKDILHDVIRHDGDIDISLSSLNELNEISKSNNILLIDCNNNNFIDKMIDLKNETDYLITSDVEEYIEITSFKDIMINIFENLLNNNLFPNNSYYYNTIIDILKDYHYDTSKLPKKKFDVIENIYQYDENNEGFDDLSTLNRTGSYYYDSDSQSKLSSKASSKSSKTSSKISKVSSKKTSKTSSKISSETTSIYESETESEKVKKMNNFNKELIMRMKYNKKDKKEIKKKRRNREKKIIKEMNNLINELNQKKEIIEKLHNEIKIINEIESGYISE